MDQTVDRTTASEHAEESARSCGIAVGMPQPADRCSPRRGRWRVSTDRGSFSRVRRYVLTGLRVWGAEPAGEQSIIAVAERLNRSPVNARSPTQIRSKRPLIGLHLMRSPDMTSSDRVGDSADARLHPYAPLTLAPFRSEAAPLAAFSTSVGPANLARESKRRSDGAVRRQPRMTLWN